MIRASLADPAWPLRMKCVPMSGQRFQEELSFLVVDFHGVRLSASTREIDPHFVFIGGICRSSGGKLELEGQELYLWTAELVMLGAILVLELAMWWDGRKSGQKSVVREHHSSERP